MGPIVATTSDDESSGSGSGSGSSSRGSGSGFEIAPRAPELSDSEASFDDVGDAELLALGAEMALSSRVKSDLIDDAYNRLRGRALFFF
jgi:hypothetical protein